MAKRLNKSLRRVESLEKHEAVVPSMKVDIGNGVLVEQGTLSGLKSASNNATKYARHLLKTVFTRDELKGKSLRGKKSNAYKEAEVKEALDPVRLKAVLAPTDTLEPRCAWHGPVPRGYRRGDAAMAAARGEPSGNPWELTDDALEPGSRRGGSAALRIAAAQEQAAADPLPQRAGGASLDVRDATQDAGVQCSVTLDFQPRIAPGGLSQLGHNRSPSSVRLSGWMDGWQAVQGPRFPGGRRQAEVDTVYCEGCGGRAPQASGELMDLSEDDPWDQWCGCGGSLSLQTTRLRRAGYPADLLDNISKKLILLSRSRPKEAPSGTRSARPACIPYSHNTAHRLRALAHRFGTRVLFTCKFKLGGMCKRVTNPEPPPTCTKKHAQCFRPCTREKVYSIPLVCGAEYIGQTGRCVNDRLREHAKEISSPSPDSFHPVVAHAKNCPSCTPDFSKTKILGGHKSRFGREILESLHIKSSVSNLSSPSLSLSDREIRFLRGERVPPKT
ncbi:hypothetical protein HPB47_017438 [Ixodes persulcatus]|uniref:Uncharacterized protein n=1 Tax=Ixodes persulcatus TaxID=34615 RepID=A0AC60R0U1_IXOPE|nr:hypothetical protein HPB47_017438 [Ixodes persulcatus]